MKLNALIGESRFITAPGRQDAPLFLPPLEFGNVLPVELQAWKKSLDGSLIAEDLSDYEITLLVGAPNQRPSLGFWQITTTAGTSLPIDSRASSELVKLALRAAFGETTVTGGNGSYIVTLTGNGAWTTPTASFQGNTLSSVLVFVSTPGTADTPAQYRIEVLEVAPARIVPANWEAGETIPANSFTQVNGKLWQLTLDPNVDNGFFTLEIDGSENATGFINYNSGAYGIQVALAALGRPANVIPNGTGGYWVKFDSTVTTCTIGGNLVILPFSQGALDLTGSGIRELLDGLQFAPVKLVVMLVKDGQTDTVATADAMLTMPVNQPATITIDAPAMAGLTFAISIGLDYLEVYVNGTHTYDIPLNAPSGSGSMNIYVNGHLSYSIPLNAP